MTKSISVLGKPTESIRVNGRGRERRGPSCLCEPTILPWRKPREGRTRDSQAEDEAVHGLSGHRCGPRADWRRQRRGSKDGRAMVRRGAEAWPRSQSQTQGRGDPRRASVCGAEIQGSRGFRLRETPHTKKLGRGDARPALSSSPASARQVSGLPCTAPRAPPATPPSAGKWPLTGNGSQGPRPPRHATPRHAGHPVTPLAPRTSSFRVFSGAQVKEGSRHVTTETTLRCGASRAPWGARPQPWPRPTTCLALTRSNRKCLQMFRMFFGWENNSQVNSSTLRRRL